MTGVFALSGRRILPDWLARTWQRLADESPNATQAERAAALRRHVDERILPDCIAMSRERFSEERSIKFGVIVPGIVRQVVDEWIAVKLKEGT